MIVVTAHISQPDEMRLSLTLTMSVRDWDKVAADLNSLPIGNCTPFWDLRQAVSRVLKQIRATVCEAVEP